MVRGIRAISLGIFRSYPPFFSQLDHRHQRFQLRHHLLQASVFSEISLQLSMFIAAYARSPLTPVALSSSLLNLTNISLFTHPHSSQKSASISTSTPLPPSAYIFEYPTVSDWHYHTPSRIPYYPHSPLHQILHKFTHPQHRTTGSYRSPMHPLEQRPPKWRLQMRQRRSPRLVALWL